MVQITVHFYVVCTGIVANNYSRATSLVPILVTINYLNSHLAISSFPTHRHWLYSVVTTSTTN